MPIYGVVLVSVLYIQYFINYADEDNENYSRFKNLGFRGLAKTFQSAFLRKTKFINC